MVDYLLLNENWHSGNFGAVRRAGTLEYAGPAPLFGIDSSLWFKTPTPLIYAGANAACKPFEASHEEQLRRVSNLRWLDKRKLEGLGEILREIVTGSAFIDAARRETIAQALEQRALLRKYIHSR